MMTKRKRRRRRKMRKRRKKRKKRVDVKKARLRVFVLWKEECGLPCGVDSH